MLAACPLPEPRSSRPLAGGRRCPVAELELRAVRDELVAQGIAHGMDFAVLGTGEPTALSSEIVVLRGDPDGWYVDYRDMGRDRELLCTADFAEARARFVAEVHSLAASRGRGPQATGPRETISLAEFRARRGPQAP